ncbi:hypothetical protein scyTo_0022048, partial [Scyliorhinus torazame]|nr:hypothetical protein [Scyliorhinus torazame]
MVYWKFTHLPVMGIIYEEGCCHSPRNCLRHWTVELELPVHHSLTIHNDKINSHLIYFILFSCIQIGEI